MPGERAWFRVKTPNVVIESANISAGKKEPEKSSLLLSLSGSQCKEKCGGGLQCPLALPPLGLQNGQFPLGWRRGAVGGESQSAGRCGPPPPPHHGPFTPRRQPPPRRQRHHSWLGLSSEHPLSALNLRSHHTLRSGEGPR